MKKSPYSSNINLYMLLIIINLISTYASAQFAAPGGIGNTVVGVSAVNPRCTGNDILDDGSDTYRVSVWDNNGATASIAWEVDYGGNPYSNNTPLFYSSGITDPDIALISDGTDQFAIVAYHVGGGSPRYVYETFIWDDPGSIWGFYTMGTPVLIATGNFQLSVNIDASDIGNFAICWDDNGPQVLAVTGQVTSGTFSLNNGGTPVVIATGSYPDLCIFQTGGNSKIYFTWLDNGNARLYVEDHSLGNLSSGTVSFLNQWFFGPQSGVGYLYDAPRIACPNGSVGSSSDWTVVVEESDGTDFRILGFNNGSFVADYTEDSYGVPWDIYVVNNFLPVVTYDDQTPNIYIGWQFDNSSPQWSYSSPGDPQEAIFPIVYYCDGTAMPLGVDFWQVPDGIGAGDEVSNLSLSGRFAADKIFLTYNAIIHSTANDEIFTKVANSPSSLSSLRFPKYLSNNNQNNISHLINNPVNVQNGAIEISLFDVRGNLIFEYYITGFNLVGFTEQLIEQLPASFFVIRITNLNTGEIFTRKLSVVK